MSCKPDKILALLKKTDNKSQKEAEKLLSKCPDMVLDAHKKMYCSMLTLDSDAQKKTYCGVKGDYRTSPGSLIGGAGGRNTEGGAGGRNTVGGAGGMNTEGGTGGRNTVGGAGGMNTVGGSSRPSSQAPPEENSAMYGIGDGIGGGTGRNGAGGGTGRNGAGGSTGKNGMGDDFIQLIVPTLSSEGQASRK